MGITVDGRLSCPECGEDVAGPLGPYAPEPMECRCCAVSFCGYCGGPEGRCDPRPHDWDPVLDESPSWDPDQALKAWTRSHTVRFPPVEVDFTQRRRRR